MNIGKIVAIAGPVVDVEFEEGQLPHIREALTVRINGQRRVMEVAQQVGDNTVRCIMLSASEGLGKGMPSLVISLCRYIIIMIPAAWILCRLFGPVGVWHAFWVTELLSALAAALVYKRTVKLNV